MLWSIMDNIPESIDSCQNKVSADLFHLIDFFITLQTLIVDLYHNPLLLIEG